MADKLEQIKAEMVDAAESLGISEEEYKNIVDECIFGKEESVSDGLEYELVQWWNNHYAGIDKSYTFKKYAGHYIENGTLLEIAHHFANWQNQQMMKDAVEGEVVTIHEPDFGDTHLDIMMPIPKNLKSGDKVKLIIIKEG